MELKGRRYDTGDPVQVSIEGQRIIGIQVLPRTANVDEWPIVAPGLFDLQINGHNGIWFNQKGLEPDDVLHALRPHFGHGITRLCPTLSTASHEAFIDALQAIDAACRCETWANDMVPGLHLEGPYLTAEDGPRGAHPVEHVRAADWNEFEQFQVASGNRVRHVTVAPEVEGAVPFIERATAAGIVVAIGHTGASAEQIAAAVDAGARVSTHLGNGAHLMLRRHPNYIWDQLGEPRLAATIITDGHHLPASVIRSIIAAKSTRNTVITCDAAGLAGCPPGRYQLHSNEVEILANGRIVLADQPELLVGSSLKTDSCVAHLLRVADVSLREAIDMASRNPARVLGFEQVQFEVGSRADLILFQRDDQTGAFEFLATIAAGAIQFGDIPDL